MQVFAAIEGLYRLCALLLLSNVLIPTLTHSLR